MKTVRVIYEDGRPDLVVDNVAWSGINPLLFLLIVQKGKDWDSSREPEENAASRVYNIRLTSIVQWMVEWDEEEQKKMDSSDGWRTMARGGGDE